MFDLIIKPKCIKSGNVSLDNSGNDKFLNPEMRETLDITFQMRQKLKMWAN